MNTKRKLILMTIIITLIVIPFIANAQTSLVLTKDGVDCLKKGMLFSKIPSKCPGLYDRFKKNLIEGEYEDENYTEYIFYSGTEIVAQTNDYGEGKINSIVVYSPKVSTPEGAHPGMLIKELFKIKGAKLETGSEGTRLIILNNYTIGFSFEDLTASGKKAFEDAYTKGTDIKFSNTYFKQSAKVISIECFF